MSEPGRFYSGDPGWVHFIPICNPALIRPMPPKAEGLINSERLLKLLIIPLAFLLYVCICMFVILLVPLYVN